MKKILITGTNGYIGKSLCYGLNDYNITGINRSVCDLTDADSVRNFFKNKYFDVVIHCAAAGGSRLIKEDRKIFKDNLKMFENLSFNKEHYKKLIHFGSGAQFVYPLTNYGQSKKIIADMIEEKENFYNLIIWGLFDENELNTRFIKSNVIKCMNNEPMVIHKDKYMDFFHMKDLIELVKVYINNDNFPKSIECKYMECYKLTHIAEMISIILGKTCKIERHEEGLDEPYMSKDRQSFIEGNFKDRLKETVNKIWKR
jgi:nucleoside-diphosphate-sugar epimerase